MKVSLIISTYNSPDSLRLCLKSVARQTRMPDEVIVADDGSGEDTRRLIERYARRLPCPVMHTWQEDRGFRLAESRNNALRQCHGDYVVFVDGDIIMERHFIEDHERMAQPGFFVVGSRSKLNPKVSKALISRRSIGIHPYSPGVRSRINALHMPWLAFYTKHLYSNRPGKGRGANMAVFMSDLKAVNGFDSDMTGYGLEDTDLILRLRNLGLKRHFAKFRAIEFHLYHKEEKFDKSNQTLLDRNRKRTACTHGIINDRQQQTDDNRQH